MSITVMPHTNAICCSVTLRRCVKHTFAYSAPPSLRAAESALAADIREPVAVFVSFQRM